MIIKNPEENTIIGTPAIAGKCAVAFHGKNNRLIIGEGVKFTNVSIAFRGSNGTLIIGDNCNIIGAFRIVNGSSISVGANTIFNKPCWIQSYGTTEITIGESCLFANIRIRTSDMHSIIDLDTGKRINPDASVTIGDRVWLAENVNIYKGVTIGSGSIIGAGSIVVKSIPENSLAVGTPAKVVKSNVSWNIKRL